VIWVFTFQADLFILVPERVLPHWVASAWILAINEKLLCQDKTCWERVLEKALLESKSKDAKEWQL
jgi:hypothetical protein